MEQEFKFVEVWNGLGQWEHDTLVVRLLVENESVRHQFRWGYHVAANGWRYLWGVVRSSCGHLIASALKVGTFVQYPSSTRDSNGGRFSAEVGLSEVTVGFGYHQAFASESSLLIECDAHFAICKSNFRNKWRIAYGPLVSCRKSHNSYLILRVGLSLWIFPQFKTETWRYLSKIIMPAFILQLHNASWWSDIWLTQHRRITPPDMLTGQNTSWHRRL